MGIEQLENKGFAFINADKINTEKRQIVVIGTARGGTSLVAGALHHLGIFTGEKSHPPVFEDVLLSEAFESNDLNLAKSIVENYSNNHDVWAWKRPAALNYLDKVEKVIPNPFYIFIFKDIFAIANRNSISMQADIGKGLQNALADYAQIVDFVSNTTRPVMLVSAEKALQNKESFVNALIESNIDIVDYSNNKNKALEFITPNPKDYLDKTRATKVIGNIGSVGKKFVHGWAQHLYKNDKVKIKVFVNNIFALEIEASEFRENKQGTKDSNCGFTIDISQYTMPFSLKIMASDDVIPMYDDIVDMR
ncbi:hypothetical protein MT390_09155 [Vibrio sp. 2-Bac 85]